MASISRHIALHGPLLPPVRKNGEESARTIRDFIDWLESNKGLHLCEAFKPQYDWYTPVPLNIDHLAREFLEQRKFHDLKPLENRV